MFKVKPDPYYLFMAEAEGLLDTRESKLQRIIKEVKNYPAETMPQGAFETACICNDLDPASLSPSEVRRIQRAIKT